MKKGRGISLRYKFLILLTTLPLLALASYLAIAIQVFEDDKIAYVYDASGAVSRTVSAQVRAELGAVINLSRPIVNGYDFEKNRLTEFSRQLFENEKSFAFMAFYKLSEKGTMTKSVVLKKKNDPKSEATTQTLANLEKKKRSLQGELEKIKTQKVGVLHGFNVDDRLVVGFRYGNVGDDNMLVILALVETQNFLPIFQSKSSQKVYLVDQKGQIFLGPDEATDLGKIVDEGFVSRLAGMKTPEGTAEVKTRSGTDTLISFSPVGIGGLLTAAMVNKNNALKAVDILISKSLLFFVALLSATLIISIFASGTLTSALSSLYQGTLKVAEGHFDIKLNVKSRDEVGSLAESFNTMAAEVKRLMMETAEKARMEGELKTAQTVQETLFPDKYAKIENLVIAGHYQPASECGGDWWHYCRVGRRVFVWIGDATGHGAPAALITSAAKSAATIIERLNVTPGMALELLNRSIYDVSKGQLMMTFFLGAYDLDTGDFVYSNASHDPPFLFQKEEGPLKKKHLVPLNDVNNPRLGQDRDTTYKDYTMKLPPGSSIFLYTDGIPELYNDDGEMWGERSFIKAVLKSNADYPGPDVAIERMIEQIVDFKGVAPLRDDVTFFQIHLSEGAST